MRSPSCGRRCAGGSWSCAIPARIPDGRRKSVKISTLCADCTAAGRFNGLSRRGFALSSPAHHLPSQPARRSREAKEGANRRRDARGPEKAMPTGLSNKTQGWQYASSDISGVAGDGAGTFLSPAHGASIPRRPTPRDRATGMSPLRKFGGNPFTCGWETSPPVSFSGSRRCSPVFDARTVREPGFRAVRTGGHS